MHHSQGTKGKTINRHAHSRSPEYACCISCLILPVRIIYFSCGEYKHGTHPPNNSLDYDEARVYTRSLGPYHGAVRWVVSVKIPVADHLDQRERHEGKLGHHDPRKTGRRARDEHGRQRETSVRKWHQGTREEYAGVRGRINQPTQVQSERGEERVDKPMKNTNTISF